MRAENREWVGGTYVSPALHFYSPFWDWVASSRKVILKGVCILGVIPGSAELLLAGRGNHNRRDLGKRQCWEPRGPWDAEGGEEKT